ncbi:YacL family protein [Chromatiaceae bacterium AAb-1]|nr:YacL family protein [Chromatiaceae bacterium AAb-1]
MEYEFIYDSRKQQCSMRLSGEHEALSRFLLDELTVSTGGSQLLIKQLESLPPYQNWEYQGREFSLQLEQREVRVSHNSLFFTDDSELSERQRNKLEGDDLHPDQQGLYSECGMEDLLVLLHAWQQFLEENTTRRK